MTQTALLPVAPEGVQWTPRSLAVLDPSLPLERFEELLRAAGEFKSAASFWIGDLINFGEARYGERYAQAIDATGLSYSTLSNYAYVCRQIAPSRRREGLRFSHHAEVAALEPAEQDRWLAQADEKGWSREELRDAMRTAASLPPGGGGHSAATNGAAGSSGQSSRRQEVLEGVEVVEATRELAVVHAALTLTHDALNGATGVEGLEEAVPKALRAVEELGQTVRLAAAKMAAPSLVDAGHALVRAATRSSGFAMIPEATFEAFRQALEKEKA